MKESHQVILIKMEKSNYGLSKSITHHKLLSDKNILLAARYQNAAFA